MASSAPAAPAPASTPVATASAATAINTGTATAAPVAPVQPATPLPGASSPPPAASVTPDALAALSGVPPAAPAPSVTDMAAEGIYLQFGAFSSDISADQLTNRLNAEIAHVESRNVHVDSSSTLHRVRLGPYPNRTAAVNAAVRIQEVTGMQPTLAQR